MTIAVDLGRKATKQKNQSSVIFQALDSCAFKAIFGHWSCHDKIRLGRADEN